MSIENARAEVTTAFAELAAAIAEGDDSKIITADKVLSEKESDYADSVMEDAFVKCKQTENPLLTAITMHSVDTIGHKLSRDKDSGKVESVESTVKKVVIDIVKLYKFCNGRTPEWSYSVEKLGQLLCIRAARELGMSDAQIARIPKLYRMSEVSAREDLGENPTSNSQLVKILQGIINKIAFIPGDKNPKANKISVNQHDAAYFMMCYTKRSKEVGQVTVATTKFLISLLTDVMHIRVTEKCYGVNFKVNRGMDIAELYAPEPAEVSDSQKNPPEPKTPDTEVSDSQKNQPETAEVSAPKKRKSKKSAEPVIIVTEAEGKGE